MEEESERTPENSGFMDDEMEVEGETDEDTQRMSVNIPGASEASAESADCGPGTPPLDFGFSQKMEFGDIPSTTSQCQPSLSIGDGPVTRSAAKKGGPRYPESSASILGKGRVGGQSIRKAREQKRKEIPASMDPDFNGEEFLLRTGNPDELRDYVVAKFLTRQPKFSDKSSVRLFRDSESTVLQRNKATEKDKKEQKFYESFVGRQKRKVHELEDSVFVPKRYRSGWHLETKQNHSGDSSQSDEDVFKGTFLGKPTAQYAIIAIQDEKTADVTLIDDYAWFSFQAAQITKEDVELTCGENDPQEKEITAAEKKLKKAKEKRKKVESKLSNKVARLEENFESAQVQRDRCVGDNSRVKRARNYVPVGLSRRRSWKGDGNESENEVKEENFDYELEFEDDEVDEEEITEPHEKVSFDNRSKRKRVNRFRMLETDSVSGSSDSDESSNSEENPTAVVENPEERTSRSGGTSCGSKRGTAVAKTSLETTRGQSGPDGSAVTLSRSSPASLDLSHLLPKKGTLPTVKHARAVLAAISKQGECVLLKDCIAYFENKTKVQKDNLKKIFRKVGNVLWRKNEQGKKDIYVMLKFT